MVSSDALPLPPHLKSSPSAPALSAASALPAVTWEKATTSAAACAFDVGLFLPRKPMPLPPCSRRACVNKSCSLAIATLKSPYRDLLRDETPLCHVRNICFNCVRIGRLFP